MEGDDNGIHGGVQGVVMGDEYGPARFSVHQINDHVVDEELLDYCDI